MEKICIIGGVGHIGLPLGIVFAQKGVKTCLLDINEKNAALVKAGKLPFMEEGGEAALAEALKSGNLEVSLDPTAITSADIIILAVDTPTGQFLDPSYGRVIKVFEEYMPYFRTGQIVILRSTVYPGMSERVQWLFEQSGKGDVGIAFCPERIVQGKALQEQENLPQIISAFKPEVLDKVKNLFLQINKTVLPAESPLEAELVKLFSNAWRYISFAAANQFYVMATSRGVDYAHLHEIMTHGYERNKALPKPGFAAGPCLVKDTAQLLAFSNNNFQMGQSAIAANEGLPNQILEQLRVKYGSGLREKTIGILGMAFKAESDDNRNSLSYKLRDIARLECKVVFAHDVYIRDESFQVDLDKFLKYSDIVILATPHAAYKDIDPASYPDKDFVDMWGFWAKEK